MSRGAFLQQRPGGNYQNYLSYLARNRPGWNPNNPYASQRIAPPTRGPIPTYASLLARINFQNPAQMEAQANRMAQTDLKYQQQLISSDYADRMKTAMAQQLASQAAGRAAAAMNSQLMGLVGSGYSGAANEVQALGGSLGAAMAGASAADVAAAGATAGNVGAPAPAVGGASPIAGPSQEGVEVFRGATLPAEALGTAGTAAQTGLGGLIQAQNLRATQEAQAAYMQALGDANQARSSAVRALVAQRPDIASKYLLQLQDAQRQQIALASGLIGNIQQSKAAKIARAGAVIANKGATIRNQAATAALAQVDAEKSITLGKVVDAMGRPIKGAKLKDLPEYQKLQQAATAAGIQMSRIDPSASRALGWLVDRGGRIMRNPKTKQPIPYAASPSRGGAGGRVMGGYTPGQASRLMQQAQNMAEGMYYGYTTLPSGRRVPVNQAPGFGPDSKFGTGVLDYGPALNRLTQIGVPLAYAREILNNYWQVPGQHGRPVWDSTAQQNEIKKHYGAKHYSEIMRNIQMAVNRGDWAAVQRFRNLALSERNFGWADMGR